MIKFDDLEEKCTSSKCVFDGEVLHVYYDKITLPNGNPATRELIKHVGAVCIIPINDKGNVIVERQFRYPINRVITEIPAGKLNYSTEDRLSAAQREFMEETGYTADEWIDLGIYYPAPAYSDEKITMYLATKLHSGKQNLDEDEFLNIEEIPLNELVTQVMNGNITDGKTQICILKAAKYLNI